MSYKKYLEGYKAMLEYFDENDEYDSVNIVSARRLLLKMEAIIDEEDRKLLKSLDNKAMELIKTVSPDSWGGIALRQLSELISKSKV